MINMGHLFLLYWGFSILFAIGFADQVNDQNSDDRFITTVMAVLLAPIILPYTFGRVIGRNKKEVSNNKPKTNRQIAMNWWNKLGLVQKVNAINSSTLNGRHTKSLTGREIERVYQEVIVDRNTATVR